jgi:hypothetical protein
MREENGVLEQRKDEHRTSNVQHRTSKKKDKPKLFPLYYEEKVRVRRRKLLTPVS